MTTFQQIIQALESVPESQLTKILTFIELVKNQEQSDITITESLLLSESALAKDWLSEEEEETWQDL
ncbi:MAG: DUF2281 domain-containing protein [Crocosphaera sp.]